MTYDIPVLENMIDHYTRNIKMFMTYSRVTGEAHIAEMVGNRRLIASFIENGGESTVPANFRNGNIFFDSILYAACDDGDIK